MLIEEKVMVRRCRSGEPEARREMYETYAGRLLAVCRRYIPDPDTAQDIVHDAFLKAWNSIGSFQPRRAGSLGAWLVRITIHMAIDELRKSKLFFPLEEEDIQPVEEAPVDPSWLRNVPVETLIDMIASLPEGYRTVFNLFCLDGWSHREIAHMLGIAEKTSQTQYLKARLKLAAMIAAKYRENESE